MSEIYTKTGDDGTSGLLGKGRFPKNHPRFDAIGDVDEANAAFGVARAHSKRKETKEIILSIQRDLYRLMSELASTPDNDERFQYINKDHTTWIEEQISKIGNYVTIPKEFIVPGDTQAGSYLDLARTVVRRAERRICSLFQTGELKNIEILHYINRLSSLCYILELWEIDGQISTQY
jgi:cob(I)alamin adenosyltransferase